MHILTFNHSCLQFGTNINVLKVFMSCSIDFIRKFNVYLKKLISSVGETNRPIAHHLITIRSLDIPHYLWWKEMIRYDDISTSDFICFLKFEFISLCYCVELQLKQNIWVFPYICQQTSQKRLYYEIKTNN